MNEAIWEQAQVRFVYEEQSNKIAMRFAALMLEVPANAHPAEGKFSLEAQGDYDFLLKVHQREILAHYSVFFPKGENTAGGRYQFLLLPERHMAAYQKPELLLEFEFNRSGIFQIDGEELLTEPASYQRSGVRNIVLMYAMTKLQQLLI
jgi:hypothetical protein